MTWSLNEVEGLARKAARGSGLSWGLSEEAGKSARWLESKGLPGAEILSALLTLNDGKSYETICPEATSGHWDAKGGHLCPLIAGTTICDHASDLKAGHDIDLGKTTYPMLLLPLIAGAARLSGKVIEVTWQGMTAIVTADGDIGFSEDTALLASEVEAVSIRATEAQADNVLAQRLRVDIPGDIAAALGAFAHRTYAPDTPESRLAGAGAGLTDND